jgi:hypothetical protein
MSLAKKIIRHHYSWLLLLVLIAYWPFTFQQIVVPHDMVNAWIPWRHFISDTIQNGEFPWWNPYQQMGYPIHADLQGPTWHLESLIASLIGRQGPIYIQYIMLFYIYLGGVGMYKLTSVFSTNKKIFLLAGAAYMCSGFFTNHSMHLFSIISAAMVPHIIYHIIRLYESKDILHAFYAAIFTFFNLTGGNQTFTIIIFYLLFIIFVHYAIKVGWTDKVKRKVFIRHSFVFASSVAAMGAVIFLVFVQFKPYLSRLSNMTIEAAGIYPFTPNACYSLINPMVPLNESEWIGTDGTMSNVYFGLVFLLFFALSFFRKKTSLEKIFLGFGIISFLAAFGTQTFVYEFLFEYVPFMDRFRMPAYFTYFFMITAIVLGARSIEIYLSKEGKSPFQFYSVSMVLSLIVLITIIYGAVHLSGTKFMASDDGFYRMFLYTDKYQNFFFYGLIQLILIGLIIFSYRKKRLKLLVITVFIDCIISVQPNLINLGQNGNKPHLIEASLDTYNVKGMPNYSFVINNIVPHQPVPHLMMNVNHLHKTVSYEGFNSTYFSTLGSIVTHHMDYAKIIWSNHVYYLSDHIISENQYLSDTSNQITQDITIVKNEDLAAFSGVKVSPNDEIRMLDFKPSYFKFEAKTESQSALNLLQSEYVGWKVYIDGKPSTIYKTNTMFMSVVVPEGNHIVEFRYQNTPIKIAAFVSYGSFVLILLIIVGTIRKRMLNERLENKKGL